MKPMDEILALPTIEEQFERAREQCMTPEGARLVTDDPRFERWLRENKAAIIAIDYRRRKVA